MPRADDALETLNAFIKVRTFAKTRACIKTVSTIYILTPYLRYFKINTIQLYTIKGYLALGCTIKRNT